jgi:NADH:ubiquinone reductase (H+-translocating)
MSDVLILGGGFAAVWSAMATARLCGQHGGQLSILLVAPHDDLVIRPRLYQADPGTMRVPLDRILRPIGVARIAATATAIDWSRGSVSVMGRGPTHELRYRRLILATGQRHPAP